MVSGGQYVAVARWFRSELKDNRLRMHNRRPEHVKMADFSYDLPVERIANRPLFVRDESKLLVFEGGANNITHYAFSKLPELLPEGSLLIANRSRVVPARILCEKDTGGRVEVLLTEPISPSQDPAVVLQSANVSQWNCLIGGRNVMAGSILTEPLTGTQILVVEREYSEGVVELQLDGTASLAEVLQNVGHVPLPPYIRRADDDLDKNQYQTIFAKEDGSVAAPTAGLHFTDETLAGLQKRRITEAEVTLHVGLGTFQPVGVDDITDHTMHRERIEIHSSTISAVIEESHKPHGFVTSVGTTSTRTLESVYWFGARLLLGEDVASDLLCNQWAAFAEGPFPSRLKSFEEVQRWMKENGTEKLVGYTQLCLAPGAHIAVVDALVTNFHQSGNTLIMLVAAFIGPAWRDVYDSALENAYRFLSYGDSSLLIREQRR